MVLNNALQVLQVNTNINNGTGPVITPEIIGKVAPLFGNQDNMIIFSAVVVGLGLRTVYRYYQEKKKGNPEAQAFDMKFLYTALVAFITAGLPALAFMPTATATFNSFAPQWGIVFAWAFTVGGIYAANAGINAAVSGFENKTITNAVSSGKLDRVIQARIGVLQGSQKGQKEEQTQETTTRAQESGSEST